MILADLESYLNLLAGFYVPGAKTPPVTLDEYDQKFVQSVAMQAMTGAALSALQAPMAERILRKYRAQLAAYNIELPDKFAYRLPLRTVDRTSSVSVVDVNGTPRIEIKFPYNQQLIDIIKIEAKATKAMCGHTAWNHTRKAWMFSVTEASVNWVVTFAKIYGLTIDDTLKQMFASIEEVEQTPYAIELKVNENGWEITNAAPSMLEYIAAQGWGDDLVKLFDAQSVLAFTVDPAITNTFREAYGDPFAYFCSHRSIDLDAKNKYTVAQLIDWAKEVDRFPIVVYNPNVINFDTTVYTSQFREDEVLVVRRGKKMPESIDQSVKLVYTEVAPPGVSKIPLLISHANLLNGKSKKQLLASAEKVAYNCIPLPR